MINKLSPCFLKRKLLDYTSERHKMAISPTELNSLSTEDKDAVSELEELIDEKLLLLSGDTPEVNLDKQDVARLLGTRMEPRCKELYQRYLKVGWAEAFLSNNYTFKLRRWGSNND